jgi:hypothetical protein
MAAASGNYVHFVVMYGGKTEKCRVTETALLNRERVSKKNMKHERLACVYRKLKPGRSGDEVRQGRRVI